MQTKYETIVIGAGISGCAAAQKIARKGQRVLLLESSSQIGGRTKSINHNFSNFQMMVNLGCSNIYQYDLKHPIAKLFLKCENVNLIQKKSEKHKTFSEDGKDLSENFEDRTIEFQSLIERKVWKKKNMTFQQAIKYFEAQKLNDPLFMHFINQIESYTSSEISDLAANEGQNDQQLNSSQSEMFVVSSHQAVCDMLAKHKNVDVQVGRQVLQIKSQVIEEKEVTKIICKGGQIFTAKNVIVSVPLGVLKSGKMIFTPQLPVKKVEAIKNLSFGNICKVYFTFPHFKQIMSQRNEFSFGIVPNDVSKRGLATRFVNLCATSAIEALICCGYGANADQMESLQPKKLKELLALRILSLTGTKIDPETIEFKRTNYRQDTNFLGASTYASLKVTPKDWEEMAKPVFERKLYFCGQHTSTWYRGTTYGAYFSGIEAANCVLDRIKQKDWDYWQEEEDI